MKDRTSMYPGRVKLVPVEGMANTYTLSWADEPQQEGTPLNKATLLSDIVAAALRLSQEDPTVNDAFAGIVSGFSMVTAKTRPPVAADGGKAGDLWLDITSAANHEYSLYICLGVNDGGAIWASAASYRKVLKTELIKESGSWTVPGRVVGDAKVTVFGAGGSGARHDSVASSPGAGGAGGYRQEWTGQLNPGDVYYITIGKGGAGAASSSGKTGGSTSFGSIVSAAGGTGASAIKGGTGGSGGGAGGGAGRIGEFGVGEQFGSGGNSSTAPTAGIDTTSMGMLPEEQGTGAPGTTASGGGGGGGGGYGGMGGNGTSYGGGGGGGFGKNGNGGNGAELRTGKAGSGGYCAGGGGCGSTGTPGAGGSGICMITYYVMEVA